ncbi:methyl-accepting chemotaxis protein [Rhodocyclus tenuis]|uniref:methyl-accepting chemotaxis protein n=1 Tax=Rhodocyclus tenuis TaxID=1066 RepID=UPI0019051558|nr:methyl-accepting chemotaxis protein [Rhodocyclus tenuis]MBK1680473.1 hypothetical protein [Rhodocyclus tenuis]
MLDLTIKARVLILGFVAIVGVIICSALGIFQLSRVNAQLETDMNQVRLETRTLIDIQTASVDFKTQVQEWKNILIRGNKEEEFTKHEKAFFDQEAAVQERLKKVVAVMKQEADPAKAEALANIEQLIKDHAELGVGYKAALAGFDRDDPETGKKLDVAVKGKDRATTAGLTKIVAALEKSQVEFLEQQTIDAQENYASARNVLIGLMALGFVLASTLAYFTVRQVARQIALLQNTTADIKQTLDLTRRIGIHGKSEMALVAASVNALLDEFQAVVKRMTEAGAHASSASDQLSHSIANAADALAQQNEATSSMAAAVEQMSVSVTHVSESSASAQSIAQDSAKNATTGGEVIEKTVQDIGRIAELVQGASQAVEELGKRTDQIGNIAAVIKGIADQTNLLALNAAIEAARAGEQGRGFAVVADEVRQLAERTTSATAEIGTVISAIQSQTRSAVDDMHRVVDQVGSNAEGARAAGESIVHIREGSLRVVDVSSDIATALKEQSAASELIAKQVERIASMSEENNAAMGESRGAAAEMKRLSTELHELVGRFRA